MICNKCGHELAENAKFCSKCGVAVIPQANAAVEKAAEKAEEKTEDTAENTAEQNEDDCALKAGEEITFGTYNGPHPSNVNNGDKITWKVVRTQPGMAMLVCSRSICVATYHKSQDNTNWSECTLREWLNNAFVKQYFSQAESNQIIACTVTNSDNPLYKTPGGPQTTDKVFLLSISEAEFLFADDRSRATGEYWWLRTPGIYPNYAVCVNKHGHIDTKGYYVYGNSLCDDISVRPAMWIKV